VAQLVQLALQQIVVLHAKEPYFITMDNVYLIVLLEHTKVEINV